MKKSLVLLSIISIINVNCVFPQKNAGGISSIKASDLESHLSFLASPLLKGRLNGGEELDIAAQYISSQAKRIGLEPVAGETFLHNYTVVIKSFDRDRTSIQVTDDTINPVTIKEPIYQLYPMGASDLEIEGEAVFLGYGIRTDKYNDFDTLSISGKIVLVMDRAPSAPDGETCLLGNQAWMSINGLQMKLQPLIMGGPKAILFVTDPKSGRESLADGSSGLADYLARSMNLKGHSDQVPVIPGIPKVMFVHRKVADAILEGSGRNLSDLQEAIDNDLKSRSFAIKGKRVKITEVSVTEEKQLPNVAGIVEGRDPVLRNEVIIFSGHMDHIGGEGENINPGADDNASGCSALLELAEAFSSMAKKPLRSVMFLWVSGEEVGLFGSQAYVENPLVPLDKTVADLNMDMVGRVKGLADTTDQTPMTGENAVFVITGEQSSELVSIADKAAKKTGLELDYSLSGTSHPLSLFSRSDHYNFVMNDIPILFFTTGLHTDYHKPGDRIGKIDFMKMEHVTRTMFEIGYMVANQKTRITVDNPFSKWDSNGLVN